MKKLICMILVILLLTALTIPSFAEDVPSSPDSSETVSQGSPAASETSESSSVPEASETPGPEKTDVQPGSSEQTSVTESSAVEEITDPVKLGTFSTPRVLTGERVKFTLSFTAEDGYSIESVEMKTSTDISVYPFDIDVSTYKVFYHASSAEYPLDLRARGDAPQGYFKLPVEVVYKDRNGQETLTQFEVAVLVVASDYTPEKEEETNPAIPKVIVSKTYTDPASVVPGDPFTLYITLKNTSSTENVGNMEVFITSGDKAFSSASGTMTSFISSIAPGNTKTITMEMKAKSDIPSGIYSIDVKANYDTGPKNTPASMNEQITVNVVQMPDMKYSAIEANPFGEAYLGENVRLTANVYNTGKVPLYNVFVSFTSPEGNISSKEVFLGNIEPGATGAVDTFVSAVGLGSTTIKMEIRFEDENGAQYTKQGELNYLISEKTQNIQNVVPEPVKKDNPILMWGAVVLGMAIGAGGLFLINRRRKPKDNVFKADDEG